VLSAPSGIVNDSPHASESRDARRPLACTRTVSPADTFSTARARSPSGSVPPPTMTTWNPKRARLARSQASVSRRDAASLMRGS